MMATEKLVYTPLRHDDPSAPTQEAIATTWTTPPPQQQVSSEEDAEESVDSSTESFSLSPPSSPTYVPIKLEFPVSPTRSVSSVKSEGRRHSRPNKRSAFSRNAGISKKKHVIKRKLRSSPLRSFPTKSTRMVWMEQTFVLE